MEPLINGKSLDSAVLGIYIFGVCLRLSSSFTRTIDCQRQMSYLQIRHFVKTHLDNFETATLNKLDQCLRDCIVEKHAIYVLQEHEQVNMEGIKKDWEKELEMGIAEDTCRQRSEIR